MSRRKRLFLVCLAGIGACSPNREGSRFRPATTSAAVSRAPSAPARGPSNPPAPPQAAGGPGGSAPAPNLPVPYDRDADARQLAGDARDELGSKTESELVEDSFLLVAPGGRAALAGPIDITRRALAAYFNGRFSTRPARVISVYLFPGDSGYQRWCKLRWEAKCSSPYGFYLSEDRKIVMNVGLGIGTLTHELVHPLVEADFPKAPDWINEGIASLFEQFYLPRPGEIHGGKNWRLPRLRSALASKSERARALPAALFGMSDREFRGEREDLHYASARYLCQWLDEKGMLWPFYQRYRDHFDDDPTGEHAFRDVVGRSPAEVGTEFVRWVRAL